MNLKKGPPQRHFWAFGLSLKEHCFHQFESNLKTRHYEYAFDFEGYWYSIYSFVSMFSFFIFISYLFSKKTLFSFFKQWLFVQIYIFCAFTSFFHFLFFPIFQKTNPYFRGICLNSMAGLEFKELRRFSTIIFQHVEIHFFSKNQRGKSKAH